MSNSKNETPFTGSLLTKAFGSSHHSRLSASTPLRYENTLGATRAKLEEDDSESAIGRGCLISVKKLRGLPPADCLTGGVVTGLAS